MKQLDRALRKQARAAAPAPRTTGAGASHTASALRPEDLLRCDQSAAGARWSLFDAAWYLRSYPEVGRELADCSPPRVLDFYLAQGQRLGHAPNMFFDEAWYVGNYEDVRRLVGARTFRSGFDHYCAVGHAGHSPHWLFDDAMYKTANPDVGAADLPAAGFLNRYDHYLCCGSLENRAAHMLFDPRFYRARTADPDLEVLGPFAHFLRLIHLRSGEAETSVYFNAEWYRATFPAVGKAIGEGRYLCALHHYLCNETPADFDPLCQFSESFYRDGNPDVEAALSAGTIRSGYQHFLSHGVFELRQPAPFIDLNRYRQSRPGSHREHDEQARDAFALMLRAQQAAQPPGASAATSRVRKPAAPAAGKVATDAIGSLALEGQIDELTSEMVRGWALQPERPDAPVLLEVRDGRKLLARVQASAYRGDLRRAGWGSGHCSFAHRFDPPLSPLADHTIRVRRVSDRRELAGSPAVLAPSRQPPAAPNEAAPTEQQARALFELKAHNQLARLGRQPLDFSHEGPAEVSVIVIAHNRFALTMMALASLRANHTGAIELILVDSGSSDETQRIERYLSGAKILRIERNLGFVRGCNAALAEATAPAVLYMNNDVELAPGCLAAALHRLASDETIGAVGGKVMRTHGLLQEAGSIIWRDGRASGYLRDGSPLMPEAGFVRDVDFCSGVFLLVRGAALRALGGFDEGYAPAYYEDADLCVRLWQAGYRVVYDPAVGLTHYEYASAPSTDAALALMQKNRKIFLRNHRAWLKERYAADARFDVLARGAGGPNRRVLFIEDTVPLRGIGSGYVRANDIVRGMVALGFGVTVFPVNGCPFEPARLFADFPDTVEIMYDRTIEHLQEFLDRRAGYYDVIWISRAHNLDKVRGILERTCADSRRVSVVLDTEAIFSMREAARAQLTGARFDFEGALEREFANAWFCQHTVAVNENEAELLRRLGLTEVAMLGTMREPAPTPRAFDERTGLLFVGSMHLPDSPNYDSLCWFIDEVLPLLRRKLGEAARLTVAGYTTPAVSLKRWRRHPQVDLLGEVADLAPLYDRHRVFVAPTRFAAGAPYKVYEAAAFGLPVVASEPLRDQLGWSDGTDILVADVSDPAAFAERVATLYRSPILWESLRANALARLARENTQAGYLGRLGDILGPGHAAMPGARQPLRPTLVPAHRYTAAAE